MKLHRKAVEEVAYWLFLYLITLELSLVALYLCILLLTGQAFPPFEIEGMMTLPSFFQAFQLSTIALISFVLFKTQRSGVERPSRLFLLTMAVLLFYAAMDEVFKLHLLLYRWLPSWRPHAEREGFIWMLVATPTFFYRDFLALWHLYRRETLWVLLGLGIFSLGGFSSELIEYERLSSLLAHFFQQQDLMMLFVEKLRKVFTELVAMIGESVILYGVLLLVAKRVENWGYLESQVVSDRYME